MFSRLMILALMFGSVSAVAQSQVDIFKWRQSGSFDLQLTIDGIRNIGFSGDLPEVGAIQLTTERYTADLKSYPGFVSIIVTRDGDDLGKLFILERSKSTVFTQLNEAPILGHALEMNEDLAYALKRFADLKKLNNKEPSFAFRTMVAYFENAPDKKLDAFADDVENGSEVVRVVPPPTGGAVASTNSEIQPLPSRQSRQQRMDQQQYDQDGYPVQPRSQGPPNNDPSFEYSGNAETAVTEPAPPRKQKRRNRPAWADGPGAGYDNTTGGLY